MQAHTGRGWALRCWGEKSRERLDPNSSREGKSRSLMEEESFTAAQPGPDLPGVYLHSVLS